MRMAFKMQMSKDGVLRATVRVNYRISEKDREVIAWALDKRAGNGEPTLRKASYAEVIDAIKTGFNADEFWHEEDVNDFWKKTRIRY